MTRFLIVRHGETEWNAGGRLQGHADPPLSPVGREQAAVAARVLGRFDGIVASSGLRRAVETAEVLVRQLGAPPAIVEAAFNEIDTGDWTGLTRDEVERDWPEEAVLWRQRRLPGYPGGETRVEHWERINAGLERLAGDHPNADVLVIAHGGVLGSIERHLGCLSDQGYPHLTGRWFTLGEELEPGGRVELLAERFDG